MIDLIAIKMTAYLNEDLQFQNKPPPSRFFARGGKPPCVASPKAGMRKSLTTMSEDWQAASRRAAFQFWKQSLLYGSVAFVLFTLMWWLIKGKPPYGLFDLWLLSAVALGPFLYALRRLVAEAFNW